MMYRNGLIIATLFILFSCTNDNEYGYASAIMDDAEVCMDIAPDSALQMLRSVDIYVLKSPKLKARHALLHSIALDKNYIDIENDSIIAPAISYYLKHGSPDDKMRTLYYWGRIRQNAGDEEGAVETFVKASRYEGRMSDNATFARCCSVLGLIYSSQYDFNRSIELNDKAARYYLKAGHINSYVNSILKIADALWCLDRIDEMDEPLTGVEPYLQNVKPSVLSSYYSLRLRYAQEVSSLSAVEDVVEEYLDNVPEYQIEWNNVALSYLLAGKTTEALTAMSNFVIYDSGYMNDPGYHALLAKIEEAQGRPVPALDHYKRYLHLADSIDMVIYAQDTKFIQERYEKDMSILKGRNRNIVLSVLLLLSVVILGIAIYYLRKRNIEKRAFQEMLLMAEEEKTALSKMMSESPSNDPDIRRTIEDRLDLINEFILGSRIPNAYFQKRTQEKMDNLIADTKEYLSTIGMTYVLKCPDFVAYLKEKGLTTWEVGYCCLYIMGYSAKEIGGIMLNNQVYKISSAIRRKLEIEGGKLRFETIINDLFQRFSTS